MYLDGRVDTDHFHIASSSPTLPEKALRGGVKRDEFEVLVVGPQITQHLLERDKGLVAVYVLRAHELYELPVHAALSY